MIRKIVGQLASPIRVYVSILALTPCSRASKISTRFSTEEARVEMRKDQKSTFVLVSESFPTEKDRSVVHYAMKFK